MSDTASANTTSRHWYALRSKPKKETFAGSLLTNAGIEVYVPREKVQKQRGKPPVLEPFFPGYLFGLLDPLQAEIRLARYTPGILYVVGYGDEPWPVPDDFIAYIKQRLNRGRAWSAVEAFRPGDRLIITRGPLEGIEGIFDRSLSASGRVRVLIRMLKRMCPAELDVSSLRRIGQAAGSASL